MDAVKEESNTSAKMSKSKLRYPLRAVNKQKRHADDAGQANTPKRGKSASNVSRSMSIIDTSGKDKLAKPPRRLSVSVKPSIISPLSKSSGIVTSISETTETTSMKGQGSTRKAVTEMRNSMSRKKFSALSSVSYWLSQIKLSESASKHSISLGFFKLALDSGCEPLQRMRFELKSYVARNNLAELGEPFKELLVSYSISDDMEQVQVSETCSHLPGGTTQSSEGIHSSLSSNDSNKKMKVKSSSENIRTSSVAKPANRGNRQRVFLSTEAVKRNASKSNNVVQASHMTGATTQSSEGVHSSSSYTDGGKKLKHKSAGSENIQTSSVAKSANGENPQRIFLSKMSVNRNASGVHPKKNSRRPTRQVGKKENAKTQNHGKKENAKTQNQGENFVGDKDPVELLPTGETENDDKENKDAPQPEKICLSPEQVV